MSDTMYHFSLKDAGKGFLIIVEERDNIIPAADGGAEHKSFAKSPYAAIAEVCQKLQARYDSEQAAYNDKRRIARAFKANNLPVPEAYR